MRTLNRMVLVALLSGCATANPYAGMEASQRGTAQRQPAFQTANYQLQARDGAVVGMVATSASAILRSSVPSPMTMVETRLDVRNDSDKGIDIDPRAVRLRALSAVAGRMGDLSPDDTTGRRYIEPGGTGHITYTFTFAGDTWPKDLHALRLMTPIEHDGYVQTLVTPFVVQRPQGSSPDDRYSTLAMFYYSPFYDPLGSSEPVPRRARDMAMVDEAYPKWVTF